jgi:hypothetical protein
MRERRVLSVSLGPRSRDFDASVVVAGVPVRLARRGVDFDLDRACALLRAADGVVDAIGLGGVNLRYRFGERQYPIAEGTYLSSLVRRTPVTDGERFKEGVEPLWLDTVERKFGPLRGQTAVLVSTLDRYPLLGVLRRAGLRVIIGDAYFALGLPLALHDERVFAALVRCTLPGLSRVPLRLLYPSGRPARLRAWPRSFGRPRLVWGDLHLLLGRLPDLAGAVVVVGTLRPADVALLFERGAEAVVSGPELVPGIGLPANLWEALLLALFGPLERHELAAAWGSLAWEPRVLRSIDAYCR